MPVVGFNFTKIHFEKNNKVVSKVSVSNNVSVTSVEEANIVQQAPQAALRFKYVFTSRYDPDYAKIDMEGDVIYVDKQDKVADIMKQWKKSKQMDKEIMKEIMNSVLQKCFVEAMVIGRDMNLPSIIPIPKLEEKAATQSEGQYIG